MSQEMKNIRSKASALGGLLGISDAEFNALMGTYGAFFIDSPESTRADYDNESYIKAEEEKLRSLNWYSAGQKPQYS